MITRSRNPGYAGFSMAAGSRSSLDPCLLIVCPGFCALFVIKKAIWSRTRGLCNGIWQNVNKFGHETFNAGRCGPTLGSWRVLTRASQSSLVEGQASGDLACQRRALRSLRPPWWATAIGGGTTGRLRRGGREYGSVAVPGGGGTTGRRPDCGLGRPRPCPAAATACSAATAAWSNPQQGHGHQWSQTIT